MPTKRQFVLFLLGCALLVFSGRRANAKVPKQLRGKIFYAAKVEDAGLLPLLKQFKKAKARAEVPRAADKHWKGVMVAFFSRASYPGPITIWMFDAADKAALKKREATHIASVDRKKPQRYLVWDLDLDPNDGLNKGRRYIVRMGQIVGKRTRIYAKGEIVLGK